jgi:hypothetical protein
MLAPLDLSSSDPVNCDIQCNRGGSSSNYNHSLSIQDQSLNWRVFDASIQHHLHGWSIRHGHTERDLAGATGGDYIGDRI